MALKIFLTSILISFVALTIRNAMKQEWEGKWYQYLIAGLFLFSSAVWFASALFLIWVSI